MRDDRRREKRRPAITRRSCPHYLTFAAEEIPDGATQFKCCPPVRERGEPRKALEGLADGTIDMVVSDHPPCTPATQITRKAAIFSKHGRNFALAVRLPVTVD